MYSTSGRYRKLSSQARTPLAWMLWIRLVAIATINAFNRLNAATRQITGDYVARIVEAAAGAAA